MKTQKEMKQIAKRATKMTGVKRVFEIDAVGEYMIRTPYYEGREIVDYDTDNEWYWNEIPEEWISPDDITETGKITRHNTTTIIKEPGI